MKTIVTNTIIMLFVVAVMFTVACLRAERAVENGLVYYEEYKSIYSTTKQIDADICNLQAMPSNDKAFDLISKAALIQGKRAHLTRWIGEYNAKSKMITRNLWQSPELPYELKYEQFPCYSKEDK